MTKDLRVTIHVSCAAMARWREERALTRAAAAKLAGVDGATWGQLENLSMSAVNLAKADRGLPLDECWRVPALKISKLLRMLPEDIWTEAVRAVRQPRAVLDVAAAEMSATIAAAHDHRARLEDPERIVQRIEQRQILSRELERALARFAPHHQRGLRARLIDEETLEDAATQAGIAKERMRQVELQCLRHLRQRPAIRRMEIT